MDKQRLLELAGIVNESVYIGDPNARRELDEAINALLAVVSKHNIFHDDVMSILDSKFTEIEYEKHHS